MKQTRTHGSLRKISGIPRKYSKSIKGEQNCSKRNPTNNPHHQNQHVLQLFRTNHPSLRRRPSPPHHVFPFQRRRRPTTRTYATSSTTNPWTHRTRKQRHPNLPKTLPHSPATRSHHNHPHTPIRPTNPTTPNPTRSSRIERATTQPRPPNPHHYPL